MYKNKQSDNKETALKETGEILDEKQVVKVSAVHREKAEEDALYDGYFAIISNTPDYDVVKIRAHFLICFIALVIIRLIQHSMGTERLSVERIAKALKSADCLLERGGKSRYQENLN